MAAESRDSSAAVTAQIKIEESAFQSLRKMLEEEPFRVHFFQAVRMLQKMERDRKPVGYFVTPLGETIRFSARTSACALAESSRSSCRTRNRPKSRAIMTVYVRIKPATFSKPLP